MAPVFPGSPVRLGRGERGDADGHSNGSRTQVGALGGTTSGKTLCTLMRVH